MKRQTMSLFRCKKCGTQVWNIESQLMQFSQYADAMNSGRIHPKESDSIAISSRYVISREDIDQNGVINAQPKFISWSLVSKQDFIDKSCVLQPYTCSGCDMNCVIDPSKEWNQQKAVQEISQQIAKEVDQELVEYFSNINDQMLKPRPACKDACFKQITRSK